MPPEIIAAIYALVATVVGAVIGTGASIWTTRTQLAHATKDIAMQDLRRRVTILKDAHAAILGIRIPAPDSNYTTDQIVSRGVDAFLQRATIFLSISYLFSREDEESVQDVVGKVNQLIFRTKTREQTTFEERMQCVQDIQIAEKRISSAISERLRQDEYRLSEQLENRKC
ncbi:MAG: hypothetical protein MN733_25475 [Nitrososphaera sp.]|nr:hypothetical protein [Nitrososphaera sp.]